MKDSESSGILRRTPRPSPRPETPPMTLSDIGPRDVAAALLCRPRHRAD